MKGLNYPSGKGDWEKSPRSNPTVALNVLYDKKIKTHSLYISKHKILNHDNIIILLIIPNKKGWHYSAAKSIISVIKRKTLKPLFTKTIYSIRTKNKLKSHKKECESKLFFLVL